LRKREFLRRHGPHRPALLRGFLLERARLVVTPVGLEEVVQQLVGRSPWAGGAGLEFGRRVVQRLHTALRQDGQACRLETTVSDPPAAGGHRAHGQLTCQPPWPIAESRKSLTDQLRAAGPIHDVADLATVTVRLPGASAGDVVQLLQDVWKKTDLVRVLLLHPPSAVRQMTASWAETPTR
jgi:hypothetical protein